MCDVQKLAVRLVLSGLAVGLLAGALAPAKAQTVTQTQSKKRKQENHARHETNATRLARVARTTEETYSHRYEVIGGGGFLRFRSGDYTRKNNEVSWATALNYYLNPKLALVGDARGSFGDAHAYTNNEFGVYKPQINEYTFMGGASYRFYAREKLAVSVQALGGTAWGIFSGGSKGIPGPDLGLWNDGLRPAFSLGVSADYNIYPNLALRFTPTWVGTNFVGANGSSIQNNLGLNVGIVYRFGRQ
jgi:Ni/Co efflux regulator RcnB